MNDVNGNFTTRSEARNERFRVVCRAFRFRTPEMKELARLTGLPRAKLERCLRRSDSDRYEEMHHMTWLKVQAAMVEMGITEQQQDEVLRDVD